MKRTALSIIGSTVIVCVGLLSGCGQPNTANNSALNPPATSNTSTKAKSGGTEIAGGTKYQGQANLTKYENAAKQKAKDASAQIDAAKAAYVNGDIATAIIYYKKAIAINPKSGLALTNLGNIYLRSKGQPKTALTYYQKATQSEPSYGYGWYNLGVTQAQLGNKTTAVKTLQTGLKKVKSSDPAYKMMVSEVKTLQVKSS